MYASYEEDAKFRDEKWNEKFDPEHNRKRIVMHDATAIPWMTPKMRTNSEHCLVITMVHVVQKQESVINFVGGSEGCRS